MLEFHKRWYSANIMKLCITGNHSIEVMEKWVRELFATVENKDVEVPKLGVVPAYDESNL